MMKIRDIEREYKRNEKKIMMVKISRTLVNTSKHESIFYVTHLKENKTYSIHKKRIPTSCYTNLFLYR